MDGRFYRGLWIDYHRGTNTYSVYSDAGSLLKDSLATVVDAQRFCDKFIAARAGGN